MALGDGQIGQGESSPGQCCFDGCGFDGMDGKSMAMEGLQRDVQVGVENFGVEVQMRKVQRGGG